MTTEEPLLCFLRGGMAKARYAGRGQALSRRDCPHLSSTWPWGIRASRQWSGAQGRIKEVGAWVLGQLMCNHGVRRVVYYPWGLGALVGAVSKAPGVPASGSN